MSKGCEYSLYLWGGDLIPAEGLYFLCACCPTSSLPHLSNFCYTHIALTDDSFRATQLLACHSHLGAQTEQRWSHFPMQLNFPSALFASRELYAYFLCTCEMLSCQFKCLKWLQSGSQLNCHSCQTNERVKWALFTKGQLRSESSQFFGKCTMRVSGNVWWSDVR